MNGLESGKEQRSDNHIWALEGSAPSREKSKTIEIYFALTIDFIIAPKLLIINIMMMMSTFPENGQH